MTTESSDNLVENQTQFEADNLLDNSPVPDPEAPNEAISLKGGTLIFERAMDVDPATGQVVSYWPEYWPLSAFATRYIASGPPVFMASYQNDPSGLEGNILKYDWLSFYVEDELITARTVAGIPDGETGTIYAAADPDEGGESADSDFCAAIIMEVIGNIGYFRHLMMQRLPIEMQAQTLEDFFSIAMPNFVVIEDTSAKGYVYNAFRNEVNNGAGSIHPITIEKPQSRQALGNKQVRFLSMAPRFNNHQIRIPGLLTPDGSPTHHPDWDMWIQQWRSFPSGHDDGLDAAYWVQWKAFGTPPAAAASKKAKTAEDSITAALQNDPSVAGVNCERTAHLAFGREIIHCNRCLSELTSVIADGQKRMVELGLRQNDQQWGRQQRKGQRGSVGSQTRRRRRF